MITLGQAITNNKNGIIKFFEKTRKIGCKIYKLALKIDYINRMITLTLIAISGRHCILQIQDYVRFEYFF
jgi:hypothetical protein